MDKLKSDLVSILMFNEIENNSKVKFAHWILENINEEHMLLMTQQEMAESSGFSYKTVTATVKALSKANFMGKLQSGCYIVNSEFEIKTEPVKQQESKQQEIPQEKLQKKDIRLIKSLYNAGLDVEAILKEMSKSVENINADMIKSIVSHPML